MKERGFGGIYLPTYKDKKTGDLKQSSIWWIQYYAHGKKKLENSHSRNRNDALKLLKKRLGEVVEGKLIASAIERTRFNDLSDMLINDYLPNQRQAVTNKSETFRFPPERVLRLIAGGFRCLNNGGGPSDLNTGVC